MIFRFPIVLPKFFSSVAYGSQDMALAKACFLKHKKMAGISSGHGWPPDSPFERAKSAPFSYSPRAARADPTGSNNAVCRASSA
ncbi:MAG: hypothetical protein K0R59_1919 [Sphingobacterium sp.]|nr:hypothetical protein [Sphingobacterium sp.]